jgi:hypothetical protein
VDYACLHMNKRLWKDHRMSDKGTYHCVFRRPKRTECMGASRCILFHILAAELRALSLLGKLSTT